MVRKLLVILINSIYAFHVYSQINLGQPLEGVGQKNYLGYQVAMPDNSTIGVAGKGDTDVPGFVKVFRLKNGIWVQKGQTLIENTYIRMGTRLDMPDSNTLVYATNYGEDYVKVFKWNGSFWVQKGQTIDGEFSDLAGCSVSMPDSNTLAVGAERYNYDGASGKVTIFKWRDNLWVPKGSPILGVGGSFRGDFGRYVDMPDSNTIAIGAPSNDSIADEAGSVSVFEWRDTSWFQKGSSFFGEYEDDRLGDLGQISMPDSNTIAVSSLGFGYGLHYSDRGKVMIFNWDGMAWQKKGSDLIGEDSEGGFGRAICMPSKDLIAVSSWRNINLPAPYNYKDNVTIVKWDSGSWEQKGELIFGKSDYGSSNFGNDIDMPNENHLIVGDYSLYSDEIGFGAGLVNVFKFSGIQSSVYNDINQNCLKDSLEYGLVSGIVGVINPGNHVVQTNHNGVWHIDSLPAGSYTITFDSTKKWMSDCGYSQSFIISNMDSSYLLPSFGMYNTAPCPNPEINIVMPRMRPGFSNQKIYFNVKNNSLATGTLENSYVLVDLDSMITVDGSSLSYPMSLTQVGDLWRCYLGDINPGEEVSFSLNTTVSVNTVLGQTLCISASVFPLDSCILDTIKADLPVDFVPCDIPWDKSSISVDGWCQNDSIFFTIKNTGDNGGGDMQCYSPVRLFVDGVYIRLDSIQLQGQEVDTLIFSGDGRTWRLEVDQHPLHPGNSNPNITIELCGDINNWTEDLVTILPQDDAEPIKDIYCGIVTGSYDPNDKMGYPLGVTDSQFVLPNKQLEYLIRFQNTGTDTAFNVVIRDTLDSDLNIYSVQTGVSSHHYEFKMYGQNILEWSFYNILLPDSNVDLSGSNGYVKFSVLQNKNLPDFTEINNSAAIYFDFNPPIITNETSHIIKRGVHSPNWSVSDTIIDSTNVCEQSTEFNGVIYTKAGTSYQVVGDTLYTVQILISNTKVFASVSDSVICLGDTIVLFGNGAESYTWSDNVLDNMKYVPDLSKAYTVVGTDIYGCLDSASIFVKVDTLPVVLAGNDTAICIFDSIVLSGSGAQNYIWNNDGVDGQFYVVDSNSTMILTGIDVNGCLNTDTFAINVNFLPNVRAGSDTILCVLDTIKINGGGAQNYIWSGGVINGQDYVAHSDQLLIVQGVDSNGCKNVDSLLIEVSMPNVVANSNFIKICPGDSVNLYGAGAESYSWSDGIEDGITFSLDSTNIYSVVGTDVYGCTGEDSITINVNDTIPNAEFSYQLVGATLQGYDSSSMDVTSYLWRINDSLIGNQSSFSNILTKNGNYNLCLIASNDCHSDTICKEFSVTNVGFEHVIQSELIKVFPNPTTDYLIFSSDKININTIRIISSVGVVWNNDLEITSDSYKLDISHLESGLYFYELVNGEEVLGIGRFVKE